VQEDQPVPGLPPIATVLAQRSLRSLKKVSIGVEWGYDMHEVELPFDRWLRILGGEQDSISTGYYYEGEPFTADWCFDINNADQLVVGYDDGGTGWIGNLGGVDVLEGPVIEGVDIAQVALQAKSSC
jgi:hypothetical protein